MRQTHSNCPRCGDDKETTDHVLQCQGEGVQDLWTAELQQLEEWMTKNHFHTEITTSIIDNLNQWRDQTESKYEPSNHLLQLALQEQKQIGWNTFLEGFWSKHFNECQKEHLQLINKNRPCFYYPKHNAGSRK